MLDQLCSLTGWHRDYARTRLRDAGEVRLVRVGRARRPIYSARVVSALELCWRVARAPAGKLLAPILPILVPMLRRDGELDLSDDEAYADPHLCRRLGKTRIARFMHRHSHGRWNTAHAAAVLAAAQETLELWGDELDFGELADDLAIEAELALTITTQIHELEQRIDVMRRALDPTDILRSVPGVGSINAAQILARLADPSRFRSLAGVRSYSGLVPSLNSSGRNGIQGGPTKSGDALLREALFNSADVARKTDPTLAQRYHRLMTEAGKHHSRLQHRSDAPNSNRVVLALRTALRNSRCRRHGDHT